MQYWRFLEIQVVTQFSQLLPNWAKFCTIRQNLSGMSDQVNFRTTHSGSHPRSAWSWIVSSWSRAAEPRAGWNQGSLFYKPTSDQKVSPYHPDVERLICLSSQLKQNSCTVTPFFSHPLPWFVQYRWGSFLQKLHLKFEAKNIINIMKSWLCLAVARRTNHGIDCDDTMINIQRT